MKILNLTSFVERFAASVLREDSQTCELKGHVGMKTQVAAANDGRVTVAVTYGLVRVLQSVQTGRASRVYGVTGPCN